MLEARCARIVHKVINSCFAVQASMCVISKRIKFVGWMTEGRSTMVEESKAEMAHRPAILGIQSRSFYILNKEKRACDGVQSALKNAGSKMKNDA